ncbi:MAG: hypothetical protein JO257_16455 [Deltaproteobacteria bacterium]|nr:hypothetical protein [Deltaproteobacteria bacterium]
MTRQRTLVVATAAACVAALWGMLANAWLVGHDRIGLLGVEMCADYCEVKSWGDLHAPAELFWLGGLTLLGAIHTIGFAIHAIVQAHRGRLDKIRVGWTIASAVTTLVPGAIFLVRAQSALRGEAASLGYAPFVEAAGVIAAAVLVRQLRTGR